MAEKNLLERIKRLCVEEGQCLIWQGLTARGPLPMIHIGNSNVSARRKLYEFLNGVTVEADRVVRTTCGEKLCMNPDHLICMTRTKAKKLDGANGAYNTARMQAIRYRTTRERAKLTIEQAREIRASEESARALAKRYGVAHKQINLIRQGLAWQEVFSPFAGLIAANDSGRRRA